MTSHSSSRKGIIEPGQFWRMWLPASCAVAFAAAMFWSLFRRPEIAFFCDDRPARWIVYPTVPDLITRPDGPWRTVFYRRFTIAKLPREVRLSVKAFKEFHVALNGVEVSRSAHDQSWKLLHATKVRNAALRVGENELVATVMCHRGPPALWLTLEYDSEMVTSDGRWQASLLGAEVQPVRLAASAPEFRRGSAPAQSERPLSSLGRVWPILCFGLFTAATAFLFRHRLPGMKAWFTEKGDWLFCGLIALAWLAVLVWNWKSLPFFLGFDSRLHLEYVEYIARHGSLPTGSEGKEMWQPPLYYLISAILTSLFGVPASSQTAVILARAMAYLLSLMQLFSLAACLRRLLPNNFAPRAAALLLAGCLPPQIYLMHYNSNDLLAAAFATASLYAAVAVIQSPRASIRQSVCQGILLGLTVVAKLTAWPVVLAILLVLFWQLLAERRPAREWMARIAVLVTATLTCGWYFIRNSRNFGGPLPPDQAGFAYGQDLGYSMPIHFVRFGQALVQPFYSAFAGIPDGLYSTLWGDGDWGGEVSIEMRPPWNYDLMAVTYLLAIVPSLLIVAGLGKILKQVLCTWRPERLLLLGTSSASLCGIIYFYLHHPIYGAIKAHYALPGIASLCLFMAEGYALVAGQRFWRQAVLATALGTWGLASLACYVVLPGSPETSVRFVRQLVLDGDLDQALEETESALRRHVGDLRLRLMEGRIQEWAQRYSEARTAVAAVVQANPADFDADLRLAHVLAALGRSDESVPLLENVVRLAPDNPDGYRELALLSLRQGNPDTAQRVARAGLRTAPSDSLLHFILAETSMQFGQIDQAIVHYQIATAFDPDYTPALSVLAHFYATHSDARYRNTAKAIELAERASHLTEKSNPMIEDILAAAYAEAGDFATAERTLHAAIERLPPAAPSALREQLERHLRHAKAKEPWRDQPP